MSVYIYLVLGSAVVLRSELEELEPTEELEDEVARVVAMLRRPGDCATEAGYLGTERLVEVDEQEDRRVGEPVPEQGGGRRRGRGGGSGRLAGRKFILLRDGGVWRRRTCLRVVVGAGVAAHPERRLGVATLLRA